MARREGQVPSFSQTPIYSKPPRFLHPIRNKWNLMIFIFFSPKFKTTLVSFRFGYSGLTELRVDLMAHKSQSKTLAFRALNAFISFHFLYLATQQSLLKGWQLQHGQLQLAGRNLGRVFNFRFGHLQAEHFRCCQVTLPNLVLKTWPK